MDLLTYFGTYFGNAKKFKKWYKEAFFLFSATPMKM